MAVLLKKLWMSYDLVYEKLPDPRTKSWPLVFKAHEGIAVLAIYVLFVLKWGPKWMQNRPPFNLDKLLLVYNSIQIVFCAYIFYECLVHAWAWNYRWVCEPVDFSDSPNAINVATFVYHYYLTKYLDMLDTVFFVLRKKFNQVSFLHVFHHTNMVAITWGAVVYFPGGHGTLVALINSFVHVVMYFYYLLTVFRPDTKQSVWWKKHLTQLQIAQIAILIFHFSLLLVTPNCEYPWWSAILIIPSDFFLLCLFVNFYVRTYINPESKTDEIGANEKHKNSQVGENVNGVHESGFIQNNPVLRQREIRSGEGVVHT